MLSLTFIHLSDIHFRFRKSGAKYDLDSQIRNELERDISQFFNQGLEFKGAFVTGDIAFSGSQADYLLAAEWLDKLAGLANFDPVNVWCIPGNHDVDRTAYKGKPAINAMHDSLRTAGQSLEDTLRELCETDWEGKALFSTLENYNTFATPYNCQSTRNDLYWEEESLELGYGYSLRIRGINSAIISSHKDGNLANRQLVVSKIQSTHSREDGVIRLSMCHHPPTWLSDHDTFEQQMKAPNTVPIQLFGHEHRFQSEKEDEYLRLYAGAIQPDRLGEDWLPRYNILTVDVESELEKLWLKVRVYPRRWSDAQQFESDEDACDLGNCFEWKKEFPRLKVPVRGDKTMSEDSQAVEGQETFEAKSHVEDFRRLLYSFVTLPYTDALKIAVSLEITSENDPTLDEIDLLRAYMTRAREQNKLSEMWDKVSLKNHSLSTENPFKDQ